ncbi:DUF177 domain-containing protein [uncultured Roseobacter sp.]|uniref:YceD family protein n=1 Tax=uncultured Roseobacter sp. TaxID=114847 RepID=UPI002604E21A|nr:DUF177 domain-containing protein [uncultured Roseobacter sp.]
MARQPTPHPAALRVADLNPNAKAAFSLRPEADALRALASELDLLGLRKLSFTGHVTSQGRTDWSLTGTLGATVVQPCGVTLEPVTTRLDVPVTRTYLADYNETTAPETEMPEDDTIEPLGQWIDPEQVMIEALVLALPLYPRSTDEPADPQVFAEKGVAPMRDEDAKPFAGLAALKAQMDDPTKE